MPTGHYKHTGVLDERPELLQQMIAMRKSGKSHEDISLLAGRSVCWVSHALKPFGIRVYVKPKPYTRKTRPRKEKTVDPERWPCGILKDGWLRCFECRCLNRFECDAYMGKRR